MRKGLALCLCVLLLIGLMPVSAAAEAETESQNYDGYLVQLYEPVAFQLFADDEGVEPVILENGLYWVDSLQTAERLSLKAGVRFVEPNYYVTLFDEPNDPYYTEQWNLEMLGVESAWSMGLDGEGVRIGVVDSGLDANHPDLQESNIVAGHNYYDDNEDTGDTYGHGTFVTGIIAASTGNNAGVAGIADGVELVPLKCFNDRTTTIAAVVQALWGGVDDYHCDILNMSFGAADTSTFSASQALQETIEHVQESGTILVAAVGNYGNSILYYPAAYDSVIGVGNVQKDKTISSTSQTNESVFVVAPGTDVWGLALTSADDLYRTWSGTSFSCPTVTAVAALLKQCWPEMTSEQLMDLLKKTSEDLGEPGYDTTYGYGLISVPDLMQALTWKADLTMTKTEKGLLITGCCPDSASEMKIWAASYGETGQMISCIPLTAVVSEHDGTLGMNTLLTLEEGTAEVKLFFYDAQSLSPLCPAKDIFIQQS